MKKVFGFTKDCAGMIAFWAIIICAGLYFLFDDIFPPVRVYVVVDGLDTKKVVGVRVEEDGLWKEEPVSWLDNYYGPREEFYIDPNSEE